MPHGRVMERRPLGDGVRELVMLDKKHPYQDLFGNDVFWVVVKDGHPVLFDVYKRHYSFYEYKDGRRDNPAYPQRKLIFGPGQKLPMITPDGKAIIGYRNFFDASEQVGVNCNFFRNEGAFDRKILSSKLLLESGLFVRGKWGNVRLYTYVNTGQVNGDGLCFKRAGWSKCGRTKTRDLLILEKHLT